jgi:hypothetical protein
VNDAARANVASRQGPLLRGASAASPASLIDGVAASFAGACAATGTVLADHYRIAGAPVCLEFASAALRERLTPAFSHLKDVRESGEPPLTIHLWDSASTGSPAPPHPPAPEDHAPGALYHFHEPPIRGVYQPGFEALSVLDGEAREAWHWVGSAFELAYWDQACPIRQILFWWLGSRGCLQVHGASIGTATGGVLVVGKGGSGKSTVALSSLGTDLLYAGDDYVAVRVEPSPRVESLYCSGKLEPDHVHTLLPHLLPLLANADRIDSEKAVLYVQEHFADQTTSGFPLRAVLVPRVAASQRESRIVESSRASAFAALAPSTILQLHTADSGAFALMSQLIERVPCYGLELGSEVAAIPGTIAEFLAQLPPG